MTYTIKFVNFTLGALFQNNLGHWWGVCVLPALYGSPWTGWHHMTGTAKWVHNTYNNLYTWGTSTSCWNPVLINVVSTDILYSHIYHHWAIINQRCQSSLTILHQFHFRTCTPNEQDLRSTVRSTAGFRTAHWASEGFPTFWYSTCTLLILLHCSFIHEMMQNAPNVAVKKAKHGQ